MQDFLVQWVRFVIGQVCYDGGYIIVNVDDVVFDVGVINIVSFVRFNNNVVQILWVIDVDQIIQYIIGYCFDIGLQQNVCWGYVYFMYLFDGFICQGCVVLYDLGWDFGVIFLCCVLYYFLVVLLCVLYGQVNGIVIVYICDDVFGIEVQNGVNVFLSRIFWYVNYCILFELLCCLCYIAFVVVVGGGCESYFFVDGIFQVFK